MYKFGLLGKHIDYSFSRGYFSKKFKKESLDYTYENFDIDDIKLFPDIIKNTLNLKGLNVTIPYKEAIIPYLDKLDKTAKKIGAVNTIKITEKGKLVGYNTDYYGFQESIQPYLRSHHKNALILGTGGASKAIAYALDQLSIRFDYVSRTKSDAVKYTYDSILEKDLSSYQIIINCTPLGTHPNTNSCPDIPYDGLDSSHLLFDLIYNPDETKFLSIGKIKRTTTHNGAEMLELQAEKAWTIWNKLN